MSAQKVESDSKMNHDDLGISKKSSRFQEALKSAEKIVDHPNEKVFMEPQKAIITLQSAEKAQY
jgi:hypothetical protein